MRKLRIAEVTPLAMRIMSIPLFILAFVFSSYAFSNSIPIHGRVTDESGSPLPGATVQVKGTNRQTVTDNKGYFTLSDVDPSSVLVISYVGYTGLEAPINNHSEVNVTLKAADNSLNQVVVIGYGTAKKKDVVSAVNIVAAKDAGANTATSPAQLLIGKAAGVQVIQNSGQPGAGAQIIIRGTGSFTSVEIGRAHV